MSLLPQGDLNPDCGLTVQLLSSDSAAFRRIQEPTLFFLPHCASSMYHNLLAANWDVVCLPKLAILGNSFVAMVDNWNNLSAKQQETRPCPQGILSLVEAKAVVDVPVKECGFPVRGAFNDMSVMMFPGLPKEPSLLNSLSLDHLLPDASSM